MPIAESDVFVHCISASGGRLQCRSGNLDKHIQKQPAREECRTPSRPENGVRSRTRAAGKIQPLFSGAQNAPPQTARPDTVQHAAEDAI